MNQKQLNPYPYQNFTCDNCQSEFRNETTYSLAPSLDQAEGYSTYCSDCVKIGEEEKTKSKNNKKTKS